MHTSAIQIAANRLNAQKSTGPITEIGKSKVAGNAIKHGLFSKNLILAEEDTFEYQSLLDQLQTEMNPQGVLEQALVERIAVSLWRQKRLIRAETAYIELELMPKKLVDDVNEELNLSFSGRNLTENDLMEFDTGKFQWCEAILKEYESIDLINALDVGQLKKSVPLMYQEFLICAETANQSPEEYLREFDQPNDFFIGLARYCRKQIKQAKQRPLVLKVAQMVKNKRAILKDKSREALATYQIKLDNELYKAMKALREAQEWRFKTLTVISEENGFVFRN